MTREECIALLIRYAEYDGMGIPNLAGCKEAMKMAAELLSKPSIPSNLDEAARRYVTPPNALGIRTFKAGAEWMAGQGVSMPGKVGIYGVDVESITEELREAGFTLGEEVVLQIRKKS